METIKKLMYAGLGLVKHTDDVVKEKFNEFVESGKQIDEEGKNLINDLFKTLDESKEKIGDVTLDQIQKIDDIVRKMTK